MIPRRFGHRIREREAGSGYRPQPRSAGLRPARRAAAAVAAARRVPALRGAAVALPSALPGLNAVVDLSHHNATPDFAAARADGILGVIHKATQGLSFVDPAYGPRRTAALAAGLRWGAYHFGTGADGAAQADHFLDVVQPDGRTLLALDLEANPQGPSMTLEQARAFVERVASRAGRHPGVYGGHYLKELLGGDGDPVLGRCWLWLSQYAATPSLPSAWSAWTFWQYTDGAAGPPPHAVAGIGPCDRDTFAGDPAALSQLWNA